MNPDSLLHAHRKILLDTLQNPNQTAQTQTQTQTSSQTPPPPAYTPTPTTQHPFPFPTSTLLALTNTTNTPNTENQPYNTDDDDDNYSAPPPPPITIKIDSTTKVVGHGNVLVYSPTETATRVAAMLVAALRQAKVLEGGEPRPVEISVLAGVSVVGCRNVVGATGLRGAVKGVEKGAEGEGAEGSGGGRKRGAEEDLVEMPRAKKAEMREGQ